jgi:hypothetical protein
MVIISAVPWSGTSWYDPYACLYGFSTNINTPDWLFRGLHSGLTAPSHFFKRGKNRVDWGWCHAPNCPSIDWLSPVPWLSTSKYKPSACCYGFSMNINTLDWLLRVLHSRPTAPSHYFKRDTNQVDWSWWHAPDCCIDRLSPVPWSSTSKYDPSACRYGFSRNINTPDWLFRVLHSGPTAPSHYFMRDTNQVDWSWCAAPDCCIDRLSPVPWLSSSKYEPSACCYATSYYFMRGRNQVDWSWCAAPDCCIDRLSLVPWLSTSKYDPSACHYMASVRT